MMMTPLTRRRRPLPLKRCLLVLLVQLVALLLTSKNGWPFVNAQNQRFHPEDANFEKACYSAPPPQQQNDKVDLNSLLSLCPTLIGLDKVNSTTLHSLAVEYAPYLFLHPLEGFSLSSVNWTLSKGRLLFNDDWIVDTNNDGKSDTLDLNTLLLRTTRDAYLGMNKELYYIQHDDLTKDYVYGQGYNDQGQSLAPIYYNIIQQETGAWIINYYFYFTYKGAYTLGILGSENSHHNNNAALIEHYKMQIPPLGSHEGDWQGLSVMLCPTTTFTQPLAISYFQEETFDTSSSGDSSTTSPSSTVNTVARTFYCTLGDCVFYKDSFNPVAFLALNTHIPFSVSSSNIYTQQYYNSNNNNDDNGEFFYNLQGVYRVEQTNYLGADGRYRYFAPNENNVVKLLSPSQIADKTTARQKDTSNDPSDYWQAFGGRWGGRALYEAPVTNGLYQLGQPVCFNYQGTRPVTCNPDNTSTLFTLFMELLGIESPVTTTSTTNGDTRAEIYNNNVIEQSQVLRNMVQSWWQQTAVGPRGPATMARFDRWIIDTPDLMYASTSNDDNNSDMSTSKTLSMVCNMLGYSSGNENSNDDHTNHQDTTSIPRDYIMPTIVDRTNNISIINHLYGMLLLGIVLLLLNLFIMSQLSWRAKPFLLLCFDEEGHVIAPNNRLLLYLYKPAIVYTLFYAFTLAGLTIYFFGFSQLVETLQLTRGITVTAVQNWSYMMGFVVIFLDTLMLVVIWFPSRHLRLQVQMVYNEMTGNDIKKREVELRMCCDGRVTRISFQMAYGFLFGGFILSLLCVVVGSIDVGVAYYSLELCQDRVGAIDGVCVDFPAWGVMIKCGEEFNAFCLQWTTHQSILTLWGAFIVVLCHFYLLSAAGALSILIRTVPSHLRILPNRSIYLEQLSYRQPGSNEVFSSFVGGEIVTLKEEDGESSTVGLVPTSSPKLLTSPSLGSETKLGKDTPPASPLRKDSPKTRPKRSIEGKVDERTPPASPSRDPNKPRSKKTSKSKKKERQKLSPKTENEDTAPATSTSQPDETSIAASISSIEGPNTPLTRSKRRKSRNKRDPKRSRKKRESENVSLPIAPLLVDDSEEDTTSDTGAKTEERRKLLVKETRNSDSKVHEKNPKASDFVTTRIDA